MFVAMSRFLVANDMSEPVRDAFRNRPHKVDQAEGFLRMEVISPLDAPEQFWLITHWRDRESFEHWHRSHAFHDAHQGIPSGLKVDPDFTALQYFELVAE